MADRRSARSLSRRITPQPPPPAQQALVKLEPTKRVTRSQSREVDDNAVGPASKQAPRRPRRGSDELGSSVPAVGDLSTVQEVEDDDEDHYDEAPQTPPPVDRQAVVPHRSPGGASEMSGTTAISSLSMVDADDLDAELILEHVDDLYFACQKFLDVLAPERGDDPATIKGLRMPGSRISEKFRMRDEALDLHMDVFRKPPHQYVKRQAVLQAFFGKGELSATPTGAELVLFKANLVVFAKQMVTSQREHESIWYALRELDISFPSFFLSSLQDDAAVSVGGSRLISETFALALEIRTQLAILVLLRASEREGFQPDEALTEVFLTVADNGQEIGFRGWELPGLGGSGTQLPDEFETRIQNRVEAIRRHFNRDSPSLENGEYVNFDALMNRYEWDGFIRIVLHWVRLRNREIESSMLKEGGINGVVMALKDQVASPPAPSRYSLPARPSPKEQRSNKSHRKKGSRSFDPTTSLDRGALDFLRQKTNEIPNSHDLGSQLVEALVPQPVQQIEAHGAELDDERPVLGEDDEETEDLERENSASAEIPTSSATLLGRIKRREMIEKENSRRRFIDPQPNPVRVQFGDGFDDPQPNESRSPHKRRREVHDNPESDSDSDSMFVRDDRPSRTEERRQKAPLRKKARFFTEPSSSTQVPQSSAPVAHTSILVPRSSALVPRSSAPLPPSNQTSLSRRQGKQPVGAIRPASPSDTEITRSKYPDVHELAMQRKRQKAVAEERSREFWTEEETEALMEYMEMFPRRYAHIKKYDAANGDIFAKRTAEDLRYRAKNMFINYVRAGLGIPPGFKNVIGRTTQKAQDLIRDGFTWPED